jgi:penicillin-binding protein 2
MLTPGAFEDRRSSQGRLAVLRVAAIACFGLLAIGFWMIQVLGYTKYKEIAENNYLRTIPLRAPRGVLFDRNGARLVENRDSFTIAIIRERSANIAEAVHRLALAVGVDEVRIKEIVQRHAKDPLFNPIAVVEHASLAQVSAVLARQLELPEVVVQQVPTRAYPAGGLAAHLFGYVGEIDKVQLGRPEYSGLQQGAMVGQAGIEMIYNAMLMGKDGKKDVVVNHFGRELQELGQADPEEGRRLQLTIDLDMQRALEEAYKADDLAGAAIFMDPRTGEVLALTSQPAYDPNDFASGLDRAKLAALNADPLKPFGNRLLQGRYSPGSTFKILIATAALSEGLITPETEFTCHGTAIFYGTPFHCDKKEGHGRLDLRHAIEQSCNIYFYNVGSLLTVDQIHEYAEKLGLVGKTGIDLPGEAESLVPSTEWKLKTTGEKWYPGETISVAIGQGAVSVTPISLATMMATVANGGTVVTPHILKAVDEGHGWKPVDAAPPRSVFPIRPDVLAPVRDGLWMVVNGSGTGSRARIEGYDVAGKTGTAQVISVKGKAAAAGKTDLDLRDNSWFVFFAPKDNPQIAGVVFAEHAGHGGLSSAPIARYVLDTFFAKRDGRPLPTLPPKPPPPVK